MSKKTTFYTLYIITFVIFIAIAMTYLKDLNNAVLIIIALIVAVTSRKLISFLVFKNFKERED